jgi:Tfp pilus assembly protein PilF
MRKGIDKGLSRGKTTDLLAQDAIWRAHSGDLTGAQAALEDALKMDPSNLGALDLLYQTFVARNQKVLALKKVEEYASSQPKSAGMQELFGTVLLANGDRLGARAAFTAAKAADPHFSKADERLVQLDVLEHKWDDASTRLKAMLATNATASLGGPREISKLQLWSGDVEAMRGNARGALEYFRKAVESDSQNTQALNNLAYVMVAYTKQPDEALKYAQRAVELAPQDPDSADTLGWVLYNKGLYGPAIQQLERAASKNGNPAWRYHLAMAYSKAGDPRAQSTLDAALRLSPNAPEAKAASQMVLKAK